MISYDDIWETFLENYKVEDIDLPHPDQIPSVILNALRLFNNRMGTDFKCNHTSEMIEGLTGDNNLILISHYIKLVQLKNSKVLYEKLYNPFAADVGVRNFKTQLDSLNNSIVEQKKFIDELIFNTMEDYV